MRAPSGMRRFVLMCLLLFPLSLLAGGCGSGGTVSGKITYKGQPVKGGSIYFWPEGNETRYPAIIQTDGSYTISKLPPGKAKISVMVGSAGVPPGVFSQRGGKMIEKGMEKMGQIGRSASSKEDAGQAADKKGINKEVTIVPMKYVDPDQSGLTIDVKSGKQTYDIDLKD